MRAQRIHFRDPRHGRHKGRADRSPRPYQISVRIGFPHELLGDDIHDRIPVGDDGVQLLFQTRRHLHREIFAIHFVRPAVTDIPQLLIGIFDDRRALVGVDRGDLFHHPGDLHRIVDHDLPRFCRAQVGELLQHLLRCPEKEGRLCVCIVKPFSGHNDTAVNLILWIEEMYVACRHNGFSEFFSQFHDLPVDISQILV